MMTSTRLLTSARASREPQLNARLNNCLCFLRIGSIKSAVLAVDELEEELSSALLVLDAARATLSHKGEGKSRLLPRLRPARRAVAHQAVEMHPDVGGFR